MNFRNMIKYWKDSGAEVLLGARGSGKTIMTILETLEYERDEGIISQADFEYKVKLLMGGNNEV